MASSDSKPHVIVVGAGIIGASLAWHLKLKKGADVTVIAPSFSFVTGGSDAMATPNSFAWLNAARDNPRFYYDLRMRSLSVWHRLQSTVPGLDEVMQWCTSLTWDLTDEERENYRKEHSSWGYDIKRVEREHVRTREPAIGEPSLPEWALYAGGEGVVEPVAAARLFMGDAKAHGAQLVTDSVASLLKDGDKITGVVTSDGRQLLADHVVLAAGLGSVQIAASVGVTLPVEGAAGLLVHSKPVSAKILNGIIISPSLHMRQTADGRIVAGEGFAGGDPGSSPEVTARELFNKVRVMLPGHRDELEMDFFTLGYRPKPRDGFPILGPSGKHGLTLAVMHSGVTLAPIVGELLADLIVDAKTDPDLAAFVLRRFGSLSKL